MQTGQILLCFPGGKEALVEEALRHNRAAKAGK
jgi:hypothetical protein